MPRTISSNEAKQRWGAVLGYVSDQDDEVIVESHGKPKAVVMSIAAYDELLALREQKRRADALARLRRLNKRIAERNKGTTETEEETIAFAVQLSRELIDDMAARGDIAFERDLRSH